MERGIQRLERLAKRRKKAIGLFEQGERQATVANLLKVSRQAVSQWYRAWQSGNSKLIDGAARAGRKPKLHEEQLALIEKELLRGASAHGYTADLWTLPRVARLINKITGVMYHSGHVWKILHKMGWSLQKPTLRAKERDELKVRHWLDQTWVKVKKNPKNGMLG
jgi:transposase